MYFSRACIFREFRVFFFKCEIFMSRNVSCNSLNTDYEVPYAISSLVDTRPRSHTPLLLNVKDREPVFTTSVSNPAKDKKLEWTYTTQTPERHVLCQWGVSTLYTTCCACLSSRHLTQLPSNDTVDPHIASHSMSFYLRDGTPFPSHFVETRITYNRDRMDFIEIAPSPTSHLHLKTKEARR